MSRRYSKYIGITLGLLALILRLIILLNPPTDFDGGPMLAYNFLFFFPMLLGIGILSLIAAIISVRGLIKKKSQNKSLHLLALLVSIPGLLYFLYVLTIMIIFGFMTSESVEKPDRIFNHSTSVVLDNTTLHLTGFNVGDEYEDRRIYISSIPYFNDAFEKKDAYFCQGDSNFELYYSIHSDSLFVYIPDSEPMYHYTFAENLDKIPVKAIQLNPKQLDSIRGLKSDKVERFIWQ